MKLDALKSWLDERLSISTLAKLASKKEVPLHRHSIWYYFGGMTLFLFVVQVVTGILLLLYYRPSSENAFESVQFIMTEVKFGWLIRSIHSWSANLMIATLFIHMFSVFFLRAYYPPRELTWITGVLLLFIVICFGFSGYLLPWNKLAFFATKVGTEIAGVVPIVGRPMLRFLRGGDDVTGATLTRFFGFHVAVLPATATALITIHVLLVQLHGMSVPPSLAGKPVKKMKFVPNFLLRDLIGWILAIGVLAALAALFPWELGEKADAFAPAPAGIKPEWYFLFMFQTLKYLPPKIWKIDGEVIGIMAFNLVALLLFVVPFVDRSPENHRRRLVFNVIGVLALLYIVVMTIGGYFGTSGIVISLIVICLIITVVMSAGVWKVFTKAGQPGWACIIPIYSFVVLMRIAGRPDWWALLMFIPIVNLGVWIIVCIDVAKNFGKGSGFGIGLGFLGFIFFPILGFGDAQSNPIPR